MTERVRIISNGTAMGTRVLNPDGAPIPHVMRMEIVPIEPNGAVTARLTIGLLELDLEADLALADAKARPCDVAERR